MADRQRSAFGKLIHSGRVEKVRAILEVKEV